MKIYVNRKPVTGPWGGGTKVLDAIIRALSAAGHQVTYELDQRVDRIFCVDPRPGPEPGLLSYQGIIAAIKGFPLRPKIIQRVGDIGTHGKPELSKLIYDSIPFSDAVVFPSQWAHDVIAELFLMNDRRQQMTWNVIPNAPMKTFYRHRRVKNELPELAQLRFVTHHWSTNPNKGFKFYEALDKQKVSFTFVGRTPADVQLTNRLPPASELELSELLPKFDVYVTASCYEAGANHVLEAIAAGLPVIYDRLGGSIPQDCEDFGAPFNGTISSFFEALDVLRRDYEMRIRKNIKKYKETVDDVAQKYVHLIESV